MSIIWHVKEGEQIPFLYGKIGPAYATFHQWETAIIPLNFIIKFWYWILRKTRPSKYEINISQEKQKSWNDGYDQGYVAGKKFYEDLARKLKD